jgi:hypothetical protein
LGSWPAARPLATTYAPTSSDKHGIAVVAPLRNTGRHARVWRARAIAPERLGFCSSREPNSIISLEPRPTWPATPGPLRRSKGQPCQAARSRLERLTARGASGQRRYAQQLQTSRDCGQTARNIPSATAGKHLPRPAAASIPRADQPAPTPQEDAQLARLVRYHSERNWALIAQGVPGRSGKSCRLRWLNQLSPAINKAPFNEWEDAVLLLVGDSRGLPGLSSRVPCRQPAGGQAQHAALAAAAARAHPALPSGAYTLADDHARPPAAGPQGARPALVSTGQAAEGAHRQRRQEPLERHAEAPAGARRSRRRQQVRCWAVPGTAGLQGQGQAWDPGAAAAALPPPPLPRRQHQRRSPPAVAVGTHEAMHRSRQPAPPALRPGSCRRAPPSSGCWTTQSTPSTSPRRWPERTSHCRG